MATVACGAGVCDGTCAAGYADCDGNKQSNGCETNTLTDKNNCGNCGNVCPAGEACANGACQTCNTAVLLLSDGNTALDATLSNALTTAGLVPTVIDSGATTYVGTPSATSFGAVLVIDGAQYSVDMPLTGQTAIVNAFNTGVGAVFTEWAAYESTNGRWLTLKSLLLATYVTGTTPATSTYTLTSAAHPIWTGLPTSFVTTATLAESCGAIINGGTRIATNSALSGTSPANGIIVKDAVGASGRTVHIDHAGNYNAGWTADPHLVLMFTNSAKWATKCM
jgi:hypothetical protein